MMKRVRYFPGQLLSAADFETEQSYLRAKRRLHNRWLHGWGVVGGLAVSVGGSEVVVAPGLALDGLGNEIEVCESTRWPLPTEPKACYLTVTLAERETDPVGDPATFTRIEEVAVLAYEGREPPRTSPGPTRVALARLVRSRRGWRVDSRYRTRRAR